MLRREYEYAEDAEDAGKLLSVVTAYGKYQTQTL